MRIKKIGLVPARLDHIRLKCDALVLGTLFIVQIAHLLTLLKRI